MPMVRAAAAIEPVARTLVAGPVFVTLARPGA